jgi:DNA-binding beta-propeller fold protein YncE
MMRVLATLGLTGVVMAGIAGAQGSPQPGRELWLLVSKQQPGITIYDARTDEVVCKAKTGVSPHEAAFSRDGRVAYVPVYGSANVGQPGTDEHALHVIDTADCREIAVMDTGEHTRPHAIAVGKSGLAYMTSENRQSIAIVDPKARKVVAAIPTGSSYTHFLAVTEDERQVFTSNVMSKTISVLDVPSRTMTRSIETGTNNQRMAIDRGQRWFVSQLGQERAVHFYRIQDAQLDFPVSVDGAPFVGKFSADDKYYFVMGSAPRGPGAAGTPPAGPPGLRTWKIDVAAKAVVATSSEPLGSGTGGLGINPVNGRIYISALATNQVFILDPETLKVVKQLPAEPTPDGIYFGTVK